MMDEQVNEYIEKQKSPQKEILQKIRGIFHKTLPDVEEKMRWGAPTFAGGKFYIVALKNDVNVGFSIAGLDEDEMSLFRGTGKTMRHLKFPSLEAIDEEKLVEIISMVNKKAICEQC